MFTVMGQRKLWLSAATEELESITVPLDLMKLELYAQVYIFVLSIQLTVYYGVFHTDKTCEDGTVHLVGGDSIVRGRVEYCYQGIWHSVCASDWDDRGNEATVICRSLGYVIGEDFHNC